MTPLLLEDEYVKLDTKYHRLLPFLLIAAILFFAASCTRDTYETDQEPDCTPEIVEERYAGPTRMLLGIGEGSLAAARLRGLFPDQYAVFAGVGGAVSSRGLLAQAESFLLTFDDHSDQVRAAWITLLNDLFYSLGNPLYDNQNSAFYPPGVDKGDFEGDFEPTQISGLVDRLNSDGSLNALTFQDAEGTVVHFVLALDLNGNGTRDQGEPLILQMHEDFEDSDSNGLYNTGESYSDLGLDGIAGTGDHGEANGRFDYSPIAASLFSFDPSVSVEPVDPDADLNFVGSFYTDLSVNHPLELSLTNAPLFEQLGEITTGSRDVHCLLDEPGLYQNSFWEDVYPSLTPFVPERFVRMISSGDGGDLNPDAEELESPHARRMLQALHFLSARVPNGYFGDESKESSVKYEEHDFSSSQGVSVSYSIGLPAGYYNDRSRWKTYPIMFVFPPRDTVPSDWKPLIEYQGYLTAQEYAQQVLMVIIDPEIGSDSVSEFTYFAGPADRDESDLDLDALFVEFQEHIETRYRANLN
jgi:hypothetical protein